MEIKLERYKVPDAKLIRWCFVPGCTNTAANSPNKIFVSVPLDSKKKKRWFTAARRDISKSTTKFYCCEDHFNLEEDMENYLRFKMMGGNIYMKAGVVPHKFDCQPDRKRAASGTERLTSVKRQRKQLVQEIIAGAESEKYKDDGNAVYALNIASTSAETFTKQKELEKISEGAASTSEIATSAVVPRLAPLSRRNAARFITRTKERPILPAPAPEQTVVLLSLVESAVPFPCTKLEPPCEEGANEHLGGGLEDVTQQECCSGDHFRLTTASETHENQSGCVTKEERFELVDIKSELMVQDDEQEAEVSSEHTTDADETNVTIKDELFEEELPPTIKEEPPTLGETKPATETFSCKECGKILPEDNSLCDYCHQVVTQSYSCVLESLPKTPNLLQYSGLQTSEGFIELLKYIEDDLPELEDCHKSNQLLSVLIKLHSNKDCFYVNKYRFPLVYVTTVDALSERLTFLGEAAWKNDPTPPLLQPLVGETDRKLVIFHVISLHLYLPGTIPTKDCKRIFVAYTASGKPFYFSPPYPCYKELPSMVSSSLVFSALNTKNVYVIYKLGQEFVKGTLEDFGSSWERLCDEGVQKYLEELTLRLEANFEILRNVFPDFVVLESSEVVFLRNIVSACCGLLNYELCLEQ